MLVFTGITTGLIVLCVFYPAEMQLLLYIGGISPQYML